MTFHSEQHARKKGRWGRPTWDWHVSALTEIPLRWDFLTLMPFLRKERCSCTGVTMTCVRWNLSRCRFDLFWWHFSPSRHLQFGLDWTWIHFHTWHCIVSVAPFLWHFSVSPSAKSILAASGIKESPTMPLFFFNTLRRNLSHHLFLNFHLNSSSVTVPRIDRQMDKDWQSAGPRNNTGRSEMQSVSPEWCFESKLPISHSRFVWQLDQTMDTKSVKSWSSVSIWQPLAVWTIKGFCMWSLWTKCMRRFRRLSSDYWVPVAIFRFPCHALCSYQIGVEL